MSETCTVCGAAASVVADIWSKGGEVRSVELCADCRGTIESATRDGQRLPNMAQLPPLVECISVTAEHAAPKSTPAGSARWAQKMASFGHELRPTARTREADLVK
jgi:hypothetical protein